MAASPNMAVPLQASATVTEQRLWLGTGPGGPLPAVPVVDAPASDFGLLTPTVSLGEESEGNAQDTSEFVNRGTVAGSATIDHPMRPAPFDQYSPTRLVPSIGSPTSPAQTYLQSPSSPYLQSPRS